MTQINQAEQSAWFDATPGYGFAVKVNELGVEIGNWPDQISLDWTHLSALLTLIADMRAKLHQGGGDD